MLWNYKNNTITIGLAIEMQTIIIRLVMKNMGRIIIFSFVMRTKENILTIDAVMKNTRNRNHLLCFANRKKNAIIVCFVVRSQENLQNVRFVM